MAGPDRIEIEQRGRVLRGTGSLRVSLGSMGPAGWRVLPHIEGVVAFDGRVTSADLEAMDEAEDRVELASGAEHAFSEAVVMRQIADARAANTYALRLNCYEVVP